MLSLLHALVTTHNYGALLTATLEGGTILLGPQCHAVIVPFVSDSIFARSNTVIPGCAVGDGAVPINTVVAIIIRFIIVHLILLCVITAMILLYIVPALCTIRHSIRHLAGSADMSKGKDPLILRLILFFVRPSKSEHDKIFYRFERAAVEVRIEQSNACFKKLLEEGVTTMGGNMPPEQAEMHKEFLSLCREKRETATVAARCRDHMNTTGLKSATVAAIEALRCAQEERAWAEETLEYYDKWNTAISNSIDAVVVKVALLTGENATYVMHDGQELHVVSIPQLEWQLEQKEQFLEMQRRQINHFCNVASDNSLHIGERPRVSSHPSYRSFSIQRDTSPFVRDYTVSRPTAPKVVTLVDVTTNAPEDTEDTFFEKDGPLPKFGRGTELLSEADALEEVGDATSEKNTSNDRERSAPLNPVDIEESENEDERSSDSEAHIYDPLPRPVNHEESLALLLDRDNEDAEDILNVVSSRSLSAATTVRARYKVARKLSVEDQSPKSRTSYSLDRQDKQYYSHYYVCNDGHSPKEKSKSSSRSTVAAGSIDRVSPVAMNSPLEGIEHSKKATVSQPRLGSLIISDATSKPTFYASVDAYIAHKQSNPGGIAVALNGVEGCLSREAAVRAVVNMFSSSQ